MRKVSGIIEQKLLNVNISYKLFYAAKKGHLGFRFEKKKTLHISELKSNNLYCMCRTTHTPCIGKPCHAINHYHLIRVWQAENADSCSDSLSVFSLTILFLSIFLLFPDAEWGRSRMKSTLF